MPRPLINAAIIATVLPGVPFADADTITVCASGCQFTSINAAIDAAADGDVIQLANEVYLEQAVIDLDGKAITLLGTTDTRGTPTTFIDGASTHRVLQAQSGETNATILRNLVIRNGIAESGAGMYVSSGPSIANCVFRDNVAVEGGGMHCYLGTPSLVECVLEGNAATNRGGGLWVERGSPTFADCVFRGNTAASGGGVNADAGAEFVVEGCTFESNTAADRGGAIALEDGEFRVLVECVFTDNSAFIGGAVHATGGGITTVTNSLGRGNHARGLGGFAFVENGKFTMVQAEISENTAAGFAGGVYGTSSSTVAVAASTICGNSLPQAYGWSNLGDVRLCTDCGDCESGAASGPPCETGVRGDFNCDGVYDDSDYYDMQSDLGICAADLDRDGVVSGSDLGLLFVAWGLCP